MAWLDTNPPGLKDPDKKLYLYFYSPFKKTTVKKVTGFFNRYPDKKNAKIFLDKFEARSRENKFIFDFPFMNTPMISEAFEKFKASRITDESTIETYTHAYNKFIELVGNKPLNVYTKQDGIDFIKKMNAAGLKHNSISSYSKQLAVMWKWFIEEEMTVINIIRTLPRKKMPIRTIPDSDLKKIFRWFRKHNKEQYQFVRFTYLTGFRPSTTLLLYTDLVKLKEKLIYYPNKKEKKETAFPIHNELAKLLRTMDLTPGQKLFPWHDRKLRFFTRAMKTLEMNYTLKLLRKTLGTLTANSIGIFAAQTVMDHEDASTTEGYYARSIIEQLRKNLNSKVKFVK